MSNFYVSKKGMLSSTEDINNCFKEITNLIDMLEDVEKNNSITSSSYSAIRRRISKIAEKINENNKYVDNMHVSLERIVHKYDDTENNILNFKNEEKKIRSTNEGGSGNAKTAEHPLQDLFWKVVGNFGMIGESMVAGKNINDIFTKWNSSDSDKIQSIAKNGVSVLKNADNLVCKWCDADNIKDAIFGQFKKTQIPASRPEKFIDRFGKEFDKGLSKYTLNPRLDTNTNTLKPLTKVQKISVGAKWAGAALSVVSSAFDNYKEYSGDITNPRFIKETVGEAAVGIGTGIVLTAAATALLPAAAPGVVVGAATVAASWGLDYISKKYLDKDGFNDAVADLFLDSNVERAKWVEGRLNKIKETVNSKEFKDTVSGIGNSILNAAEATILPKWAY